MKPLNHRNYGSIAHLPGSRLGPGDHHCHEGQQRICLEKARDKHDRIIVQEKLDGSNVGVAKLEDGTLKALTRAGYEAHTSPFKQHHVFADWVMRASARFMHLLAPGERVVGEWLYQAHGTRYALRHEPFVAFDIMVKDRREVFSVTHARLTHAGFVTPHLIHAGPPIDLDSALELLGPYGRHGAQDPVEGVVYRVERNELIDKSRGDSGGRRWRVDFLTKFVRNEKVDGLYLESNTGKDAILNSWPGEQGA